MPFKSKAQRRLFYAMKNRGEMDQSTIDRWEEHTPKKKLPEHVPHKKESAFYEMGRAAALQKLGGIPAVLRRGSESLELLRTMPEAVDKRISAWAQGRHIARDASRRGLPPSSYDVELGQRLRGQGRELLQTAPHRRDPLIEKLTQQI